jgi:enamine deaminase RidA (YjgF/YER057c/UK114 family)
MDRRHARSGSPYEDAIGFSRAARAGGTIAVSGTAPVWPDGEVDSDPTVQARRCWEIAVAALEELGGGVELDAVVA